MKARGPNQESAIVLESLSRREKLEAPHCPETLGLVRRLKGAEGAMCGPL